MQRSTMRAKVDRLLDDLEQAGDDDDASNESNEPWKKDPFTIYGVGIHNLLTLNSRMVCIFLVLAVLACVQMVIFRSFGGVQNLSGFAPTANWSFGSIGYPMNLCSKNIIDWSQPTVELHYEC